MENQTPLKELGYGLFGLSAAAWVVCEVYYAYASYIFRTIKENVKEPMEVLPENEGKLVYASGMLRNTKSTFLKDPQLGIELQAAKLFRKVEMFQWSKDSGKFRPVWHFDSIPSKSHPKSKKNPQWKFLTDQIYAGQEYYLAPFTVGREVVDKLTTVWDFKPVLLKPEEQEHVKKKGFVAYKDSEYYYLTKKVRRNNSYKKPVVGDYKVKYSYVPNNLYVSVIGEQRRNKIEPYKGSWLLVEEGEVPCEKLVELLDKRNSRNIWIARVLGSVLSATGVYFMYS